MKKVLLMVVALVMLCGIAHAGRYLPPRGYIGCFVDSLRNSFVWYGDPYPDPVLKYYIWCLPSRNGMMGAEFKVGIYGSFIRGYFDLNRDIVALSLGAPESGISIVVCNCALDWCWLMRQELIPTTSDAGRIEIKEHPDVGEYHFINCMPGYPHEPCWRYTHCYINEYHGCLCVGIEESSWGAIKQLFK
jgi:hypothetical protein